VNKLEETCINSSAVFERLEGAFIESINLSVAYQEKDRLDITFFAVPGLGEVAIHLRKVRYFKLDKPPDFGGEFADSVKATYLPKLDQPWPAKAEKLVTRFKGLPELVWLELIGPAGITVICEGMSFTIDSSDAS
jgi:hypothetical protein